jgi:hypothetical protein
LQPPRLLNSVQVDPLEVLDQRRYLRIALVLDGEDRVPAVRHRCPPAPLACHDHPARRSGGITAHENRLELALLDHGGGELGELSLAEPLAGLARVGNDRVDWRLEAVAEKVLARY